MRDPRGGTTLTESQVIRAFHDPPRSDDFLYSAVARQLVATGRLVDYQFIDERTLVSPRIPFVTYPFEWSDAQFVDAARLTLDVSEAALTMAHELKDGSAWNVVFDGCRPVFCDHTSFMPIERRQWWAFGQFVRHFVLPLCLSRFRGLHARTAFLSSRDGWQPDQARQAFGARRFLTRYWPLLISVRRSNVPAIRATSVVSLGATLHSNLYAFSRWLLDGLARPRVTSSDWASYSATCRSYNIATVEIKRATIARWLDFIRPKLVLDLGCNTGEYSKIAGAAGASVIAVDSDHDSVEQMYRDFRGSPGISPVVADLDDLGGSRGWMNEEFPSLITRLAGLPDAVLMLALIHHLAISRSVPYNNIARLAHRLTKRYLVVEFVGATDPMVLSLATQRNREPAEFTLQGQFEAFARWFSIVDRLELLDDKRVLVLLERK